VLYVATDAQPKTSPKLIIQAAQSAIPANGACTATLHEDMRARVFRLGNFEDVRVTRGAPQGPQPWVVPLVIDVREKEPATP
jgi:hypothetical protein